MRNTKMHLWAKLNFVLLLLFITQSASSESAIDLYSALPRVFGSEVVEYKSIEKLVADSDLIVVGRIKDVSVQLSDEYQAAGSEAPDFILADYKITLKVVPIGEREAVDVSMTMTIPPDEISLVEGVARAELPKGITVFALKGPFEDWGYACTSPQMYWCPLEIDVNRWHSPRAPHWDKVTSKDRHRPSKGSAIVLKKIAYQYGVTVKGVPFLDRNKFDEID